MHAIFNAPMAPNRGCEAVNIPGKTEDVIARLNRHFPANSSLRLDHANGSQAFPFSFLIQILETGTIINDPMFADFDTTMVFFGGFKEAIRSPPKLLFSCKSKGIFDIFIQRSLIVFEREGIVSFLLDDLSHNRPLRSHRINGDDTP